MISPAGQNGGTNGGKAGATGDYAVCDGDGVARNTKNARGAMISSSVTTDPVYPSRGSCTSDDPCGDVIDGYRIVSYRSRTSITTISDGTSNTLLIGEKHVRPDRFGIRNEDRAYYSGVNYVTAQRSAGCTVYDTSTRRCTRGIRVITPYPTYRGAFWSTIFGSWHAGGVCQFVFCDGSVRGIKPTITPENLKWLANRADGEVINTDF